ncbi:hypothetical protein D3C80_1407080 [compost metagenome]
MTRHFIKLFPQSSSRIITQPQTELSTTEVLFNFTHLQPQGTLLVYSQHYAIHLIRTGDERYRTPLPQVVLFPLLGNG